VYSFDFEGLMKKEIEHQTEIILDSIADGVFTVDSEQRITSFNRAAEEITGIEKEEAIGRRCWEVFRASICEEQCSLRRTMKTGESIVNQSIFIVNSRGERIPVSISTALLRDDGGRVIGGVETFRDLSVVEELRKELEDRHTFFDIISKNKNMQRLFRIMEQVSESDATVLLVGESGTGKELFAKAIHSLSSRSKGPMITINCGALPDTLLESELFGYKAGAFTDAKKDKPGRLAMAEGGTLFLDEIGNISPALQVRLLRVLQDRVYEPLGGTTSEEADVRIVAATNRDLDELVKEGGFRQDLYYRINVVKLSLPPLRERKEDIPLLADHFIRKFNRLNGKDIQGLSPEVMPLLMSHTFPGNIRELENIIEYATVVCKNSLIGLEHLPEYLRELAISSQDSAPKGPHKRDLSWGEMEKTFLYEALRRNAWNRKATAASLGIHPSTLWRKMKRLNLHVPKQKGQTP
jgi:PAS domain S-box-containing protein